MNEWRRSVPAVFLMWNCTKVISSARLDMCMTTYSGEIPDAANSLNWRTNPTETRK